METTVWLSDRSLLKILGTIDSSRQGCSTQELLRRVETVKMSEVNGCSEDVRSLFRRVKRVFQLKDEMEREMQVKACSSGLRCSSRRLFDESDSLLFSSSIVASSCYSRLSQTDSGFCDASHLSDQDPSPRPSLSTKGKTLTRFDHSHSSSPLISLTDSSICQLILFLCLIFVLALLSSRLVISTQVSFDTPPPT